MQETPKIFLSMILEEHEPIEMVKRAIDSIKDYVDGIYITITYKDKKPRASDFPLAKILRQLYNANISYFKWTHSFAGARNFSLNQTPKSPRNFIFWIDADDEVQGAENIRKIVDDMVLMNHSAVFLNYLYMVELDEKGQIKEILIEHKRERIIRNDDTYKWVGALHETLIEQRTENVVKVLRDEALVVHLSDAKRVDVNLKRNVDILEATVKKEQHKDPRTLIYLAKAYFDLLNMTSDEAQRRIYLSLALELFREYLEGSGKPGTAGYREGSGWAEERSTGWSYVSEIMRMQGKLDEALEALGYAIDEAPQFPKYYIDKSMIYVMKGDIAKAKLWLNLATMLPEPKTTIISTPRDLKVRALETDYHIKMAEGKIDQAEEDMKKLVEILPGLAPMRDRYETIQDLNKSNKAAQSIVFLAKYLEEKQEVLKITDLIRSIPTKIQNEKFVSEMRQKYSPPKVWREKEIAILCGQGWFNWAPPSIKTGVSGSEESVVYLSKELNKLGWKVTIYGSLSPQYETGDYDGVEYRNWYEFNLLDSFSTLVLWRSIGMVDYPLKAKQVWLWMHDVPSVNDLIEERLNKIDKIAALSEYHNSLFKMFKNGEAIDMPKGKMFLSANGIPDSDIKEWKGKPERMIYMSSLDRGLIYLLNMWPEIKKQVPEAELGIFYGTEVFDLMHKNNPYKQVWKKKIFELMKQPGITYHGKVGHRELEKEIAKSGVWVYPTSFPEISCISAMKAQAFGAIPVVTNYAALKETVRNGYKIDANIETEEGQKVYMDSLIDMLKHPKKQEEIRPAMMAWAKQQFPWSNVATQWNNLLKEGLKAKGVEV